MHTAASSLAGQSTPSKSPRRNVQTVPKPITTHTSKVGDSKLTATLQAFRAVASSTRPQHAHSITCSYCPPAAHRHAAALRLLRVTQPRVP